MSGGIPTTGYVITEGDSITAGVGSTKTYAVWATEDKSYVMSVHNFAVSGNTLGNLEARKATVLASAPAGRWIMIVQIGANDAHFETPAQFVTALESYVSSILAQVPLVVMFVGTVFPQADTDPYFPPMDFKAWRTESIALMTASTILSPLLVRYDLDPTIGPNSVGDDTSLIPDGIHPNDAFHEIAGSVLGAALDAKLANPEITPRPESPSMSLDQVMLAFGFDSAYGGSPPTITVPGSQAASSDIAKSITGTSITDTTGNSQSVTISASHGTFSLASTTGLTFTVGDGTSDASMAFSGSLANVNTALATITYTATDYSGSDALSLMANNGLGTSMATVAITVSWSPLSLGTDLRYWFDMNQLTFSDAGGTIPAVAGDALAKWKTVYPSGTTVNCATIGFPLPIYRVGANGKAYLETDGTKFMAMNGTAGSLPVQANTSMAVGIKRTGAGPGSIMDSFGKNGGNDGGGLSIDGTNAIRIFHGATTTCSSSLPSNQWLRAIGSVVWNGLVNVPTMWQDGADRSTGAVNGVVTSTSADANLFTNSNGTLSFVGYLHTIVVTNVALSNTRKALLDSFMQAQEPT